MSVIGEYPKNENIKPTEIIAIRKISGVAISNDLTESFRSISVIRSGTEIMELIIMSVIIKGG